MAAALEFRILGPLAVLADGVPVPIGGPKQRALLALLLLSANRVVSRDRLIEELFAEETVNSADHALRNQVSRLRKALTPTPDDEPRLAARSHGYLLRVGPGEFDLDCFEQLVAEGRELLGSGNPTDAARLLREAEALWRGRPLADLEFEPFARIEVERLEEVRLAAVEERVDAELALGRHLALVAELEAASEEHPYRERVRAQLMLALYRSGRQAEGLDVYRRTRKLLHDELGLEPSSELQELEHAILTQDPALRIDSGAGRAPPRYGEEVCPFKGLAAFESEDAEFFYGRERLVEELVAQLAGTTLLALVGPSGSGKSSLLRAGLLPALPGRSVLVRPAHWPSIDLPSMRAGERIVVAVDPLEELFAESVSEDARRTFLAQLVEAAWDPERRALVVLALRADHFGRLAGYGEVADLVAANTMLLGPMTSGELRRAIEGPASTVGLRIEQELVDALVDDLAGEPGALPLLSTMLLDLWLAREGGELTLAAYDRTGGVRGAVARHAEAAFLSFTDDERPAARRLFLRLVAAGDGDTWARRRVSVAELDLDDERTSSILARLVAARLVVADGEAVELVHEALLERWPRLRSWLDEDAQRGRLHRHLQATAAEWEADGRDPAELYVGTRLAAAAEWVEAAGTDAGLNRLEREFLDESRAHATRELERERRANRRLRGLLGAAAALLALVAVAGTLAFVERGAAQTRAAAADAERLGAQALVEPNLDRSLLLAREGVALDNSAATRSNLLAALVRSPAATAVLRAGDIPMLDEALSPDGRLLAVRRNDGRVLFFDTHSRRAVGPPFDAGNQLAMFGSITRPVHAFAFSPDGRTLAVGSSNGNDSELFLVDTHTHRLVAKREDDSGGAATADVVFASDGSTLYTGEAVSGRGGPPHEIVVRRRAVDGRLLRKSLPLPDARLIGFADHGRRLLVTTGERSSELLDPRTLQPTQRLSEGGAAAVSPGGNVAAFGHADGSIVLVDLRTRARHPLARRATGQVEALAFSPDGAVLASASDDGSVADWDVRTRTPGETFPGHPSAAGDPLFSPDGSQVYDSGADGSVIVWDVSGTRGLGRSFRFSAATVNVSTAVAVNPSSTLLATSPGRGQVTLWRASDLRPVGRLAGPSGDVISLAFSHDGRLVAACGDGAETVVWDVRTRKEVRELPAAPLGANGVAFSPDDRLVATAETSGGVLVYRLATGRAVATLPGQGTLEDLDFAPDGRLLAGAGLAGHIHVWDLRRGTEIHDIDNGAALLTIRFSPDGKTIATGDFGGDVGFWNPATGAAEGRPIAAQGGLLLSLSFDPRGHRLVTTSEDGKFRLWDLATGKLIGAPLPGSDTGGWGTFFPDGTHVVAAFGSGVAVVWNVDPNAWAAAACRIANRNLTRTEWRAFVPNRRYRAVCT